MFSHLRGAMLETRCSLTLLAQKVDERKLENVTLGRQFYFVLQHHILFSGFGLFRLSDNAGAVICITSILTAKLILTDCLLV